jgi:hypothetical protein
MPTSLSVPGSHSAQGSALMEHHFGDSAPFVILLRGPAAALDRQKPRLVRDLRRKGRVATVSPWDRGSSGRLRPSPVPPETRRWAYLTHFDMTLHRIYRYNGHSRSYVSAACSAPAGFDSAVFPFARATYSFANGQALSATVARSCHVAG